MMRKIQMEELQELLKKRNQGEKINLESCLLDGLDLSGADLHGIIFDKCDFRNVNLDEADMSFCTAKNAFFGGSTLRRANLANADLTSADLRGCNLSGANICGAEMYCSALYKADLTDIKTDEQTKHFHMRCPKEGAFIGWKVCFGRRIVQLLIPADAKRVQGTCHEVRCDKAKVLTIKSIDYTINYEEAHSYVDENFFYRRGQMSYVDNYCDDPYAESGGGIHVWLNRDEAIAYLA